jgi:hypothetical protein
VAGVEGWDGLFGTDEEDDEVPPTCFGDAGLPNVILGNGGITPLEDVFVLGGGLGGFAVLLASGFFSVGETTLLFCAGWPYVVQGRGGIAPLVAPLEDVFVLGGGLGGFAALLSHHLKMSWCLVEGWVVLTIGFFTVGDSTLLFCAD